MSLRDAEELHAAIVIRARLIERARESMRRGIERDALLDVLAVLDHVQAHDERLVRLHAECHSLIEHARKVLERDLAWERPPTTIIMKGDGSG